MSDDCGKDISQPDDPSSTQNVKNSNNQDEEANDSVESGVRPDLGIKISNQPQMSRRSADGLAGGSSDTPRREENPFSFKHFLSREAGNGQHTGAKPKVYTSPTFSNSVDLDYSRTSSSRNLAANPDIASVLPDFVQDHLVVEQCFLRDGASSTLSVDLDNLPDFAVNKDANLDLPTACRSRAPNYNSYLRRRERNQNSGIDSMPLDLPNVTNAHPMIDTSQNDRVGLPFDLPLVRDAACCNSSGNSSIPGLVQDIIPNNSGSNSIAGSPALPTVSKSLPDFLSDGPIRGGHLPPADITAEASGVSQNHAPEERFQTENERLRIELDMLRGQNTELSRRVHSLQTELRSLRVKEHEDTLSMEKAIEQAEDNLKRTTKRAVNAENVVSRLKQDLKQLQSEIRQLRTENWELRGGEGASTACGGGNPSSMQSPSRQIHLQHFAQELKAAASNAEGSLRQLLQGVDNLRLIASSMEVVQRVEERTKDFLSDSEEDVGSAPSK